MPSKKETKTTLKPYTVINLFVLDSWMVLNIPIYNNSYDTTTQI